MSLETAPWAGTVSSEEIQLHELAGYGARANVGEKPALIVVDVTQEFTGIGSFAQREMILHYPNACALDQGVLDRLRDLVQMFLAASLPVLNTRMTGHRGPWSAKNRRAGELHSAPAHVHDFHEAVAGIPDSCVFEKEGASAFSNGDVSRFLRQHEVDTVIVAGCTTSGCVRATVVDAFGSGYVVMVPADAVFDRSATPHAVSLFDIDMRYGNVVTTQNVASFLSALDSGTEYRPVIWKTGKEETL